MDRDELTYKIRGAIFNVHSILGPGLYEECYQQALVHELKLMGLKAEGKKKLSVVYKDLLIKNAYELDILVEDEIILELKSVKCLGDENIKQLMNYLSLTGLYVGFLINFNVSYMESKRDIIKVFNNNAKL